MAKIKPNYLAYQKDGSNKFYITLKLDNTTGLIGYGSIKTNSEGTWSVKSFNEIDKKTKEKLTKGYRYTDFKLMPKPAVEKMIVAMQKHFNTTNIEIDHNGVIEINNSTSKSKQKAPKRTRSKQIHIWI